MKRKQLLQLLSAYLPSTAEAQYKTDMIAFIEQHEDCFERTLAIGHITASALLLNHDKSKALLMHHTKLDRWFQLGGHCDGNPDVLAVAIKEAQEESGIQAITPLSEAIFDIDIHLIPENSREDTHYHYDVRFLLQTSEDAPIVQNRESKELRWVSKDVDQLPTQEPSVVRMFNKWRALP